MEPRSGGLGLKRSQAYPRRYGVKLAKEHTKFLVSRMKSDSIGILTDIPYIDRNLVLFATLDLRPGMVMVGLHFFVLRWKNLKGGMYTRPTRLGD